MSRQVDIYKDGTSNDIVDDMPYVPMRRKRDNVVSTLLVIAISLMILNYLLLLHAPLRDKEKSREEPTFTKVDTPLATPEIQGIPIGETEEEPNIMYDVPFDEDFQSHVHDLSTEADIDPHIVFAVIWQESKYDANAIGDEGRSYGLMQIQGNLYGEKIDELGITRLIDPYQNVIVGVSILSDLIERYEGHIEMALIAYNTGVTGAYRNFFSEGVYSNEYSQSVMNQAELLRSNSTYVNM